TRKRFWTEIRGSRFGADGLFEHVRDHLPDLMPSIVQMRAEPAAATSIELGATLTLEIPVRGHIQVRVAELTDRKITLLTVAGHPIAGAVRFLVEERGDALRFEVQTYDRPASVFDHLMMKTVGEWLQRGSWTGLVQNVAR